MSDNETLKYIDKLTDTLSDEKRQHLQTLILNLIQAFDPDHPERRAILILGTTNSPVAKVGTVNCSDMELTEILYELTDYMHMEVNEDAPPKEMFN